jgi:hypothetical protein
LSAPEPDPGRRPGARRAARPRPGAAGLRAIERGGAAEEQFAAVGDDWDVEGRPRTVLDRLGLGHVNLDRRVGQVSGGEAPAPTRSGRVAAGRAHQQLDLVARGCLYDAVAAWPRSWSWSATTAPCCSWSTRSPTGNSAVAAKVTTPASTPAAKATSRVRHRSWAGSVRVASPTPTAIAARKMTSPGA